MRFLLSILIFAIALCADIQAFAAAPQWEVVQTESPAVDIEKIDVVVRDGYIYVYTPRPTSVKVMSIVGQLISEKNIPAGISRIKITTRGIYILKVGDTTVRVTI